MRWTRIICCTVVVAALAFLVSCGGGGGGGANSSAAPTDAIGLQADFSNVSYLTLGDNASSITTTAQLPTSSIWQRILNVAVSNAFATTFKTNNVFAYDSNGNSINNPFKAKVNLFISAAAVDPIGKYAYLGIDSHLNEKLFTDYASIRTTACSIYRIKISGGEVTCLFKASDIDINGESIGKNIVFDAASRAYFIGRYNASSYGTNGGEKSRLIRINADGSSTIMRDVNGWWAGRMVQAKNNNIFFTENPMNSGAPSLERKFILNTTTAAISEIPVSGYVTDAISTISGDVYFISGCNLYALDQVALGVTRVNSIANNSCSGSVYTSFSTNSSGGVFVLKSGGEVFDLNFSTTVQIASVGSYAVNFKSKNDLSDIPYPALFSSGDYLLAKGSTGGVQQVCSINVKTFVKRCETFASNGASSILAMMIIKNTAYVYFLAGTSYKQAQFDLANNSSAIAIENSNVGDGGLVAALSMRPPLTLAASTANVSATVVDKKSTLTIGGQQESFTLLEIRFDGPIDNIDLSQIQVKNSSGTILPSSYSIIDNGYVLWIKVDDPTSANSLKYQLFPNGTSLTIILPAEVTLPGLLFTSGISTRSLSLTISSS
jgi:hypothetical protein